MDDTSDSDIFEDAEEYVKIEHHIYFSKTIYILKQKGYNILNEFEKKKYEKKTKRGISIYSMNTLAIYNSLCTIVDKKKNSLRLCFCLKHYLDELMFGEIKHINSFMIEDDKYDLTKLYYHPTEWIQDQDIQPYNFDEDKELNIHEAMYFVCYLKEFEDLFLEIENYLKTFKDTYTIKKKLLSIINRFRTKIKNIWDIIILTINNNFD